MHGRKSGRSPERRHVECRPVAGVPSEDPEAPAFEPSEVTVPRASAVLRQDAVILRHRRRHTEPALERLHLPVAGAREEGADRRHDAERGDRGGRADSFGERAHEEAAERV